MGIIRLQFLDDIYEHISIISRNLPIWKKRKNRQLKFNLFCTFNVRKIENKKTVSTVNFKKGKYKSKKISKGYVWLNEREKRKTE